MRRDPRELRLLHHMERSIYRVIRSVNYDPTYKWIARRWNYYFFATFANRFTQRTVNVIRPEILRDVPADKPLVVVANHLTFWDLFAISTIQFAINAQRRVGYFPVRAKFFYDNPIGMLLNVIFAGGSMWPPIFRDRKKARMNALSMRIISELTSTPEAFIGFHPEGTRNRTGDPHTLLPGQGGTGRLVFSAWQNGAVVVPVFINGLAKWLPVQLYRNLTRSVPLNVIVGEPLDFSELAKRRKNAATYQAVTDQTMRHLQVLADEEREILAAQRAAR